MSDSGGPDEGSPRPSAKLFLGGLSWDTTEEKLRDHFSKYGSIVEAVVMRDRQTGRPRGFGFVTFTSPVAADSVVEDVHVIDGRQIDCKKSVPQEMKPKARKVFVGGLSPDTTEDQFREYFSQFGDVMEAQIMQDHMSGRSRGFGFVTFAEDSSAENVFAAGTMHDLGGKKVEVKPATPKGSGSLGRPGAGSGSSVRPGGGAAMPGGSRQMPPFGGGGGGGQALFSGQTGPAGYGGGAYGMYGFPQGMVPGPGSFGMGGMPFAGMGGGGGMAAPYMVMGGMGQMGQMGQMGGYPAGAQPFAFPSTGQGMPGYAAPAGGQGGGPPPSPFMHQGSVQQQQQQQQHHTPQPYPPRPLRMMSRNGSRGSARIDSASSLDQGTAQQQQHEQQQQQQHVASVQEQMGKVSLNE
ncbi:hypothetical protein D9Q98_002132 [Chlorella vulgaris]|uniref:RRM domain-containing protein n=1 Tax=Chlorella vulgaris TaxID=3077 RepID=A0A9D4TVP9_CHLVU|nr:hypothetical protein D9Q98_002132 [Chlorella vulgaris]